MERRSLIKAMFAAPVIIAAPAIASASTADPGLARCIAAYEVAAARVDHYHREVCEPVYAARQAARDAVPHYTTQASYRSMSGKALHMSTSDAASCRTAQSYRCGTITYGGDDFTNCLAELSSLIDRREAELAEVEIKHDVTEVYDRIERLGDVSSAMLSRVEEYPVRTLPDLKVKLRFIASVLGDDLSSAFVLEELGRLTA